MRLWNRGLVAALLGASSMVYMQQKNLPLSPEERERFVVIFDESTTPLQQRTAFAALHDAHEQFPAVIGRPRISFTRVGVFGQTRRERAEELFATRDRYRSITIGFTALIGINENYDEELALYNHTSKHASGTAIRNLGALISTDGSQERIMQVILHEYGHIRGLPHVYVDDLMNFRVSSIAKKFSNASRYCLLPIEERIEGIACSSPGSLPKLMDADSAALKQYLTTQNIEDRPEEYPFTMASYTAALRLAKEPSLRAEIMRAQAYARIHKSTGLTGQTH